ncbi:MAG: apolipoprotein N-acyltransferase [Syntrophales bacterium]|nr:apolipoprotein N-acyltransferase [Syntrophales bacterium]
MPDNRVLTPVNLALSIASGILLFLSFPKFGLGIFVWFSLIPLLYALRGKTPSEGFILGLIAGLVYNIGIIYWIAFVVVRYGYLPFYLGVSVMLLLAVCLSMYVSLFSAGVVFFGRRGIPEIVSAPLLWTCLEYGKSHLFTGFPWENLAYSQYLNTFLIQIVDVTGIYGISFVVVFINCVFYDLIFNRNDKRKVLFEVLIGSVLVALILCYGMLRVVDLKETLKGVKSSKVALIQGNIDQSIKWDVKYQRKTLDIYRDLSFGALQSKPELIIWPETATPFFFQDIDDKHMDVLDVAKKSNAYLLFGSPGFEKKEGSTYYFNSAYMISPEGSVTGKYDKVHLVPYGEYVPFSSLFSFLGKLVPGVGDFRSGKGFHPLLMDEKKIGVLICFESIFPEISREYGRSGVSLLVNITNDAWFGMTSAPYQNLSMTVFRAIENRVSIARAANTGISAIIGPTGEIILKTELFKRTVLTGTVQFFDRETFYSRYGDLFTYFCFLLLFLLFISSLLRRREENDRRVVWDYKRFKK